jgi:conjugative relaxase-like TrwC/TraI family protein
MLNIAPRYDAKAVKDYFTQHLEQDDYYTKGMARVVGQVDGNSAALLNLPKEIDRDAYFRLIEQRDPVTGKLLKARSDKDARVAYEATADMPKSATLAQQLGGDERVGETFDWATTETMREMQQDAQVRVRKGGADYDQVTGNMAWIKFRHNVTRNLDDGTCDAHTHEHIIVPNFTYDAEGDRWGALQMGQIKTDALYYQSALHARHAKAMREMGYGIERDGSSYRVLGVEQSLVDKHSRRTKKIEEEAARLNITDGKKKAQLGKKTRNKEKTNKPLDQLRKEWREGATPAELASLKRARTLGMQSKPITAKQAVDYAVDHLFEDQSVVSEKRVWAEALMHGVGWVTPEEVQAEARSRKDLLYSTDKGIRYTTTEAWRQAEEKVIGRPRDGRATKKKLWEKGMELDASLDAEQKKAAEHILHSRDAVIFLRGAAGAGKSYTLNAVRQTLEKAGKWGGAYALSTQASRKNLRDSGFADADTTAKLLTDEKLQKRLAGKVVFIDEAGMLDVKQMNAIFDVAKQHDYRLILAGDSKQHPPVNGPSALALIEKYSGVRFAELMTNRRQLDPKYREAVNATRAGNDLTEDGKTTYLQRALEILDKEKRIIELPQETLYGVAAQEFLENGARYNPVTKNKESALLVTTTHAEGAAVTADIRAGRRNRKQLTGADREYTVLTNMEWSKAKRGEAVNYQPGLVVAFNQNLKGIKRGERATVIGRKGDMVTIEKSDGTRKTLELDKAKDFDVYRQGKQAFAVGDLIRPTKNGQAEPELRDGEWKRSTISNGDVYRIAKIKRNGDMVTENGLTIRHDFGFLRPGDTVTSMSSQSKTVDNLYVVMTERSMNAANLNSFYVMLSRGRKNAYIYTDNKEALVDAVKRLDVKRSATELLKTPATQAAEDRSRLLDRLANFHKHSVRRAVQSLWERGREMYQNVTQRKEQRYGR